MAEKTVCLYVISAGPNRHKIGISGDLERRVGGLQTSHYEELRPECYFPIPEGLAREAERIAHAALASQRLRGEWFDATLEQAEWAIDRGFYGAHGLTGDPYVWVDPWEGR